MLLKLVLMLLALSAGCAVVLQGTVNQGLLKSAGIGPTLIVNTLLVLTGSLGMWLVTGANTNFFPPGAQWTFYLGGLFGFIVVATVMFVFPRLGAAYAIALMVCGQCLAALVIDHFGLLGMPVSPLTLQRVLGAALVAGGVVVFRL